MPSSPGLTRVAVLDLGSNSFRLLIVDASPDGAMHTVIRDREDLSLGAEVARSGAIDGPALDAVASAVSRFAATSERVGSDVVVAIATSAIRSATNRDEVLERCANAARRPVRLLSGDDEARLAFLGIRAGVGVEHERILGVDLGGGSLEMAVGTNAALLWSASLDIGATRLAAEHIMSDPPTKSEMKSLRRHARGQLEPLREPIASFGVEQVVAAGGSVRALGRLVANERWAHPPTSVHLVSVTKRDLEAWHDRLAVLAQAERARIPGLKPRRLDVLPAAAAVLVEVLKTSGHEELIVSEWGLREGVVLEVLGFDPSAPDVGAPSIATSDRAPSRVPDVRRAAIRRMQLAWARDPGHGDHVAALAAQLCSELAPLLGFDELDAELLEHAAHIHDIGVSIASGGHHKHGAYLVEHAELHGFGAIEQAATASIVRFHKGSGPKASYLPYAALSSAWRTRVNTLTAMLRLADGFDRSHDASVEEIRARVNGRSITLTIAGAGDLDTAAAGAVSKAALLEEITGRSILIETTALA